MFILTIIYNWETLTSGHVKGYCIQKSYPLESQMCFMRLSTPSLSQIPHLANICGDREAMSKH